MKEIATNSKPLKWVLRDNSEKFYPILIGVEIIKCILVSKRVRLENLADSMIQTRLSIPNVQFVVFSRWSLINKQLIYYTSIWQIAIWNFISSFYILYRHRSLLMLINTKNWGKFDAFNNRYGGVIINNWLSD